MPPALHRFAAARQVRRMRPAFGLLASFLCLASWQTLAARGEDTVDFSRDVRPILSNNCFLCHGPDDKDRKADLRLDTEGRRLRASSTTFCHRAGQAGRERADSRGSPARSRRADAAGRLGQELNDRADRSASRRGSSKGRSGPATGPSSRRAPGGAAGEEPAAGCRNPIDAFVFGRLEREGLAALAARPIGDAAAAVEPRPDRPAADDRRSRRVSWPTTARMPTRSRSSGCWPRRITASAGAGIWLDAARYADSDGFEKDKPRYVWFYRDWVINAFNRDLPYDQFVIEQIAGDLLPNADAGPDRGHRLPAQLDDQRRRRRRSRAVPHGSDVRPHGRHRQEHARPDDPVRPVPQPQVRSAHAGRVLPDVRVPEQRPRSERRGLHAGRADAARRTAARRSRDRSRACSTARPTGTSGWPHGKTTVADDQPEWTVVQPEVDDISTGGAEVSAAGRRLDLWRRATRRRSTRCKLTVKTDAAEHHGRSAGTAERSEPAAAAGRAGRSRARAR